MQDERTMNLKGVGFVVLILCILVKLKVLFFSLDHCFSDAESFY